MMRREVLEGGVVVRRALPTIRQEGHYLGCFSETGLEPLENLSMFCCSCDKCKLAHIALIRMTRSPYSGCARDSSAHILDPRRML